MMEQDSNNLKTTPARFPVKRISYFTDTLAICCVDFPIYYIECISERHIIIAGGGGSSKTGVYNQVNVLELIPTDESCASQLVTKYHTPREIPDAIMTGALIKDSTIADARLVTTCATDAIVIYNLNFTPAHRSFVVSSYNIIKSFSLGTEFKSIKYISDGGILAGSIDGHLVTWNLKKGFKSEDPIKVHSKEIDEIDYNPITKQIITLSRSEGRYVIRNLHNGSTKEFKKDIINDKTRAVNKNLNISFNYRSCRFVYDSTKETGDSFLLVACNPMPSKGPSFVYKWSTKEDDFKILAYQAVTMDGVMAMTVSEDGRHFAIGTRSGGVAIFEVRTMRSIYKIDNAHHNAVTSLEFLPTKEESLTLTNSQQWTLLSVSIDRQLILHRPRRGSVILDILKTLLLAFLFFFAYVLMHKCYSHLIDEPIVVNENNSKATMEDVSRISEKL